MKILVEECECCDHAHFVGHTIVAQVPEGTYYALPFFGLATVALARPFKGLADKGFFFKAFGRVFVVTLLIKVKL